MEILCHTPLDTALFFTSPAAAARLCRKLPPKSLRFGFSGSAIPLYLYKDISPVISRTDTRQQRESSQLHTKRKAAAHAKPGSGIFRHPVFSIHGHLVPTVVPDALI